MNKRLHVLNGLVVATGLTLLRAPLDPYALAHSFGYLSVPIVLGTLLPDIDTEYGTHRKHGHNVFVLAGAIAYPLVFGNLYALWIGVAAHLHADLFMSDRGCALAYPLTRREWGVPGTAPRTTTIHTIAFSLLCVAQLAAVFVAVQLGVYP